MLLFRSRHLALNSPLGHFNGDQRTSLHQTHETHGDIQSLFPPTATWLSLNYGEHNPSHVRRHALPFSLYSQPFHESCSRNTNYIFHAANKNHSKKHISTSYILNLLLYIPNYNKRGNYTLSEETTQRTHKHVTTFSSLKTKLSLAKNNNNNSGWIYIYSHPRTGLLRSIRTHQCG